MTFLGQKYLAQAFELHSIHCKVIWLIGVQEIFMTWKSFNVFCVLNEILVAAKRTSRRGAPAKPSYWLFAKMDEDWTYLRKGTWKIVLRILKVKERKRFFWVCVFLNWKQKRGRRISKESSESRETWGLPWTVDFAHCFFNQWRARYNERRRSSTFCFPKGTRLGIVPRIVYLAKSAQHYPFCHIKLFDKLFSFLMNVLSY